MMRLYTPGILAVLMLLAALAFASVAHAHKVNMFAYVEGDRIFIEGYFADGKKAAQAEVTLLDSAGKTLATAVTDGEGQLTVPVPATDDIRIILNAGMGHQTEYTIFASEIGGTGKLPKAGGTAGPDDAMPAQASDGAAADATASVRSVSGGDTALETVVERAVGQAIKPLMRTVSEMREEKELGAIVGGIGYIFGILGIFFYLKARKQTGS